ncbi:uncharacterized protein LOC142620287 [Castanea sativa]|uniref:uncharacterized protein LOC142620287 n=1 Tax=Castanea sativa TaxID=21020 RepID=UPI003F64E1ED
MEANTLAKATSIGGVMDEYDKVQYMPSIDLPEIQQIGREENWMALIIVYLKDGRLPEDKDEARKLRIRAAKYVLIDKVLYKRGFSQPCLRCLTPNESNYVLREVHEGACGNYSGARSLVHKVFRASYYWLTIQADAKAYVKANGQAEIANRSLLKIIKTRLEGVKGLWPDKLPGVLWPYKTTVRTPIGETPFKLAYGTKAAIPAEVHMANHRVMKYQDEDNKEQLCLSLDLIDKVRMDAEHRAVRYKNLMVRQYDAMVKPRRFNIGDLVLKRSL